LPDLVENVDVSAGARQWPRVERWGRVDYEAALARQLALAKAVAVGDRADTLIAVEHPPTVTLGRHASTADVVAEETELVARGICVVRTDRGGQATYHGPGQVVVYPIVAIARLGLGARRWVSLLEAALLETLASFGVPGTLVESRPGVWARGGKIASLGLRISRGVSYHGVSLNVGLDVSGFGCIVPCGSAGERITSLAAERENAPTADQASETLIEAIANRLRAEVTAKGILLP
jgi:lipoate-protein ligase B